MADPARDPRFNVPLQPCGTEVPPCCPVQLQIGCGHGDRGYVLKVPGTPTRGGKYVIQMLADTAESGQALSQMLRLREMIRVGLVSSACKRGYPTGAGPGAWAVIPGDTNTGVRPAVEVVGPDTGTCAAAPFAVNAYPHELPGLIDPANPVIGVIDFLNHFVLPASPQTYGIAVQCCDGTDHFVADAEIFPGQEWTGELAIEFKEPKVEVEYKPFKDQGRRNRGTARTITTPSFDASCTISAKYLNRTLPVEFPLDFVQALSKPTELVRKVTKIKDLAQKANTLTGVKSVWETKYPKIKLSGTAKREEIKGDWKVGYAGEVALKAEPIIGIEAEVDIIDALIAAAGTASGAVVLSKIILMAREASKDSRYFELSLKLTAGASINGEIKWKGEPAADGNATWKGGGKIGGEIALKLEGVAAGANEWLNVASGAVLGGESKVSIDITVGRERPDTAASAPMVQPKLSGTGLEVYWSLFMQRTKGTIFGSRPPLREQLKDSQTKLKDENKIQLLEKWSIPSEPAFGQKPADETVSLGSFMQ